MSTAARHFRSAFRWLRGLYDDLERTRTFGLAAETAFWLFLSLIPLLAAAGLVAARVSRANWERMTPILATLPDATRVFIHNELDKVARWNGGAVGFTGAVVFVWLASTGVHAIFEAFEIESTAPRSWLKRRLLAVATCAALSLVVATLAILGPGLERVIEMATPGGSEFESSTFTDIARGILSFAIAMGYVCALYWIGIPRPGRKRAMLLPGSLVAVTLQAAMSFGYAFYLSRFTEQAAYGAGLGLVAATLMVLYLFALSLLSGAAVIRRLDEEHGARSAPKRGD
jgi:membrane protein